MVENSSTPSCGDAPINIFSPSHHHQLLHSCLSGGGASTSSSIDYPTRVFNVFLWVSLIAITALLLEKLFLFLRLWAKSTNIPGPPSPSFFRHSPRFGSRHSFLEFLSQSHQKYGSICKFWLGPSQLVVSVDDPNLVREILSKADQEKLPFTGKAFRLAFGSSSFFDCPYEQRRESFALELNAKLIGRANLNSTTVVNYVMKRVDKSMNLGIVDCTTFSQHLAFSYLGTLLFGDAFLTWSMAASYEELLMVIARDAPFWASHAITPFWRKEFRKFRSVCAQFKDLTQDIVQQCIDMDQTWSKEGEMFSPGNFLADQFDFCHLDSREVLCGNIMGIMFHGCLSTAGLVSAVLERLASYPKIQDKIYSEITMSSSKERHHVEEIPLLLATIYESARLMPSGLLLQRCSLKTDLSLQNGVDVPAGALLMVPVQLLHMNSHSWGDDAGKFDPYRFLSKSAKASDLNRETSCPEELNGKEGPLILNDPNDNPAFLPFGSGVCRNSVMRVIAILLTSLLESYEVRIHSDSGSELKSTTSHFQFQRRNC